MSRASFCRNMGRKAVISQNGLMLSVILPVILAACSQSGKERQDGYGVRPSNYSEIMPEAQSVGHQYVPATLKDSPNSPVAYHVTPSVSYEDDTLDTNLAASLELADYYRSVKRSGWQHWLQAEGPYTVLTIPNEVLEAYGKSWNNGLFGSANQARLARLIGQTILVGNWAMPRLRREAKNHGGIVETESISGVKITLRPLSGGGIQVISPDGQTRLQPGYFPQANGVFYVSETVLPVVP